MIFSLTSILACTVTVSFIIILLYLLIGYSDKEYFIDPQCIVLCVIVIIIRCVMPYEFFYTITIPDNNILPFFSQLGRQHIPRANITVQQFLLVVWLFVAVIKIIALFLRQYHIEQYVGGLPNSEAMPSLRKILADKKIKKRMEIKQVPGMAVPAIIGMKKVRILVPEHINETELHYTLLHEVQHYIHYDLYFMMLFQIVSIIYWWNPVFYILKHTAYKYLEYRVDYAVTKKISEEEKIDYLESIISLAQKGRERSFKSKLLLEFYGKNSDLYSRFENVLHSGRRHSGKLLVRFVLFAMLASTFIIVEPYYITEDVQRSTFAISEENSCFIRNQNKYELYINNKYMMTIDSINGFENIPIYNQEEKNEKN